MYRNPTLLLLVVTLAFTALSQNESAPPAQQPKQPSPLTASGRLVTAKAVFLRNLGGSSIPFDVISSAIEGWGRYTMADSPDKADLIIEVSAPTESGGVTVSSSTKPSNTHPGQNEQSTTTSRELSVQQIKMIVRDARSKMPLWSATEQPKFAMKQKAKEDNLVKASQLLVSKFHDRIETVAAGK